MLGLSWEDVDLENKVIHIRNGLKKDKEFSEDGKTIVRNFLTLGSLKTPKSRRDIPINDATANLLARYKLAQRSFINDPDIIPNMVFLNSAGHYWDESKVRVLYKNYLASIGVPYIKFHGLRHTFATRILESNVAPKVAQELLGHTNVSVTMDIYSHVLPEVKREAMDKIKGIV
ncbi:MAG: site-specific integrase [Clostridia bacterium]|nr:site-specific integrase [Clostridia bacterium]